MRSRGRDCKFTRELCRGCVSLRALRAAWSARHGVSDLSLRSDDDEVDRVLRIDGGSLCGDLGVADLPLPACIVVRGFACKSARTSSPSLPKGRGR